MRKRSIAVAFALYSMFFGVSAAYIAALHEDYVLEYDDASPADYVPPDEEGDDGEETIHDI